MPDPEHKAAKAGRFVRTMGLAFQREFERTAAERKAAEAAAARAPRPAPPPPALPPPPMPTADLFGRATFGLFLVALAALVLALLHSETVFPGAGKTVFRLVVAGVLFVEAYLLLSNWNKANQRLVQRVLNRVWGPRGAVTRRERAFARILRDALTLAGIGLLAGAVFELLRATIGS